jgi:hypothetical protein
VKTHRHHKCLTYKHLLLGDATTARDYNEAEKTKVSRLLPQETGLVEAGLWLEATPRFKVV